MRYLALLATYALVAALVLPGTISAQDEAAPGAATTPAQPAAPEPAAPEPAPAPAAPAAPAPAQAQPAQPAEPAPPAAPAPAPEPQFLGDERAEPASKPKALAAASGTVTIADFSYAPATITINQGDTVTWNNNGPTPHSATANNGSFDTGILKKGQSSSHTFDQAGSFSYFCKPHPFMKATVVVAAAQSGGGTGSSDTGSSSVGSGGTGGAEASQSDDGGAALPNTGSDSGALLLLGGLMLVLGIGMHRRTGNLPRR